MIIETDLVKSASLKILITPYELLPMKVTDLRLKISLLVWVFLDGLSLKQTREKKKDKTILRCD